MTWRQLWVLALPYRGSLLWGSVLLLAENGVALVLPWLAGLFAVRVLGPSATASPLALLLLLLLVLQAALHYANAQVMAKTAATVALDLKDKLHRRLLTLPMGYYDEGRRGDLLALMMWESDQLCGFISGTLLNLTPQLVTAAGSVLIMYSLDARLALLVSACVPLFYFVMKVVGRQLRPLGQQLQQAQADAYALVDQQLALVPLIKTFNREALESERFRQRMQEVVRLQQHQARAQSLLEPVLQLIALAAVLGLLALAGQHRMDTASLISFMLYAALLTRPVSALAGVYGQVQMARGNLAHLSAVLGERGESAGGLTLPAVTGELHFAGVSFAYPHRPPLFQLLELKIKAGETVAITGVNGSGKTTLVKLLLRLHEPAAGRILLDGHDIATLDMHFLREQISVVSQQVLLANDTVAANIGYGRPDADRAAIEQAATLAQADGFIRKLPQGYDTCIGDQGVRLSGGQRQRLALARALLKRAPVLVLDEATAMFDADGEAAMLHECKAVLAAATVLLISHRPASLALADRIVKLQQGGVFPVSGDTGR